MQTETGDIRSKAFDVFPAISVPDLFMQRVANNENWTLFDPHEVATVTGQRLENLFDTQFEAFTRLANKTMLSNSKLLFRPKSL